MGLLDGGRLDLKLAQRRSKKRFVNAVKRQMHINRITKTSVGGANRRRSIDSIFSDRSNATGDRERRQNASRTRTDSRIKRKRSGTLHDIFRGVDQLSQGETQDAQGKHTSDDTSLPASRIACSSPRGLLGEKKATLRNAAL